MPFGGGSGPTCPARCRLRGHSPPPKRGPLPERTGAPGFALGPIAKVVDQFPIESFRENPLKEPRLPAIVVKSFITTSRSPLILSSTYFPRIYSSEHQRIFC